MRYWYELYDSTDTVIESGEVEARDATEADTYADGRLAKVLPKDTKATFCVFEWPRND